MGDRLQIGVVERIGRIQGDDPAGDTPPVQFDANDGAEPDRVDQRGGDEIVELLVETRDVRQNPSDRHVDIRSGPSARAQLAVRVRLRP